MEFEGWYRAEYPRLVAWLAVAAGNVGVAEDAASEAFARAFARWDRVSRMASPTGWTYAVALNFVRRHERRRALERRVLLRQPRSSIPPPAVSPEVWDALRALPLRQRTAIALRYVLDLPQGEIADVMGIAPGTVSATLVAARATLAVLLDDDDVVGPEVTDEPR